MKKTERTATEIRQAVENKASTQLLISALKEKDKMEAMFAATNPAYAEMLKKRTKTEENKRKKIQDHYAKLDLKYAEYVMDQRIQQRS